MNFLEELASEWFEYRGYYVRRNVMVGRRPGGGYECELDIVAFHPSERHLVQIEPSTDAHSWAKRESRYGKKFKAGKKYIPELFKGLDIPKEIEQIALFQVGSKKNHKMIAGGKVMLLDDLLLKILENLKPKRLGSNAVPENFPLLRTLQLVTEYRSKVINILNV